MKKKKILFCFPELHIGGANTSLLALLAALDYEKVDVDILFLQNDPARCSQLPPKVHVLPDAARMDLWTNKARAFKLLDAVFTGKAFRVLWALLTEHHLHSPLHRTMAINQMLALVHADLCTPLEQRYDVAVAYLELWPTAYVARKVQAAKKIAWLHVDYSTAGFSPAMDCASYSAFDTILCVSEAGAESCRAAFPRYASHVSWSENILDAGRVFALAACGEVLDSRFVGGKAVRLLTVARLDICIKGIDRVESAARALKDCGCAFCWYVIGGGVQEDALRAHAAELGIADVLIYLGEKANPYPYMAKADLLVQASRSESYGLVLAEALALGTPVVATRCCATAQIVRDGMDGQIVPNTDEALAPALEKLLRHPPQLAALRRAAAARAAAPKEKPTAVMLLEQAAGIDDESNRKK